MQLIAERTLTFIRDHRTRGRKVLLRMYAPQRRDAASWSLQYSVEGPRQHELERFVIGTDAIQALHWALEIMPLELKSYGKELGGRFTYLDDDDMGFRLLHLPKK